MSRIGRDLKQRDGACFKKWSEQCLAVLPHHRDETMRKAEDHVVPDDEAAVPVAEAREKITRRDVPQLRNVVSFADESQIDAASSCPSQISVHGRSRKQCR